MWGCGAAVRPGRSRRFCGFQPPGAVREARRHANGGPVVAVGFSAGGHLVASSVALHGKERPDALVLVYPCVAGSEAWLTESSTAACNHVSPRGRARATGRPATVSGARGSHPPKSPIPPLSATQAQASSVLRSSRRRRTLPIETARLSNAPPSAHQPCTSPSPSPPSPPPASLTLLSPTPASPHSRLSPLPPLLSPAPPAPLPRVPGAQPRGAARAALPRRSIRASTARLRRRLHGRHRLPSGRGDGRLRPGRARRGHARRVLARRLWRARLRAQALLGPAVPDVAG